MARIATQAVKRTKTRQMRFTPAEDAKIAEDAKAAGLEFSEYVRRECGIRDYGRSALRRPALSRAEAPARPRPVAPDFEQRVRAMALRMPRRAAENLVRSEEERSK